MSRDSRLCDSAFRESFLKQIAPETVEAFRVVGEQLFHWMLEYPGSGPGGPRGDVLAVAADLRHGAWELDSIADDSDATVGRLVRGWAERLSQVAADIEAAGGGAQ
jgi:hypothetical protein